MWTRLSSNSVLSVVVVWHVRPLSYFMDYGKQFQYVWALLPSSLSSDAPDLLSRDISFQFRWFTWDFSGFRNSLLCGNPGIRHACFGLHSSLHASNVLHCGIYSRCHVNMNFRRLKNITRIVENIPKTVLGFHTFVMNKAPYDATAFKFPLCSDFI
jgi:hypothetical protein